MNEEEVNAQRIEWLREGDQIDDLLRKADDELRGGSNLDADLLG